MGTLCVFHRAVQVSKVDVGNEPEGFQLPSRIETSSHRRGGIPSPSLEDYCGYFPRAGEAAQTNSEGTGEMVPIYL